MTDRWTASKVADDVGGPKHTHVYIDEIRRLHAEPEKLVHRVFGSRNGSPIATNVVVRLVLLVLLSDLQLAKAFFIS